MLRMKQRGISEQCECVAHAQLIQEEKPVTYKRHIRQLLRTQTPLQNDTGIMFAIALLELQLVIQIDLNFIQMLATNLFQHR